MLIPALMVSVCHLLGAEAFVTTSDIQGRAEAFVTTGGDGFHGRCVSALASSTSASNNNNSEKRYRFIKRESKPV